MLSDSIFNLMRLDILTVGTYSEGNLFVVYDIKRQVYIVLYTLTRENKKILTLPTAPSPTTTHLIVCILFKYE